MIAPGKRASLVAPASLRIVRNWPRIETSRTRRRLPTTDLDLLSSGCFETILIAPRGRVPRVVLDRPKPLNAPNRRAMRKIASAPGATEGDPGIGRSVLAGPDRALAAGAGAKETGGLDPAGVVRAGWLTRWSPCASRWSPRRGGWRPPAAASRRRWATSSRPARRPVRSARDQARHPPGPGRPAAPRPAGRQVARRPRRA